jgi:hypothetical protein
MSNKYSDGLGPMRVDRDDVRNFERRFWFKTRLNPDHLNEQFIKEILSSHENHWDIPEMILPG